jgi:hypothetical protein
MIASRNVVPLATTAWKERSSVKRSVANVFVLACLGLVAGCKSEISGANDNDIGTDTRESPDFRTACNPMDLRYPFREADGNGSRREMADPAAVLFEDDYYIFASRAGGGVALAVERGTEMPRPRWSVSM